MTSQKCWICGSDATTGEHKTKRSDLSDVFGFVSQDEPLYFHDQKSKNRHLRSFKSKLLHSSARICSKCNNERTQPYDRAWEELSNKLRNHNPKLKPGSIVRANKIFSSNSKKRMLDAYLYFIKLFGCHIVESGALIDLEPFSKALLEGRFHPNVYIKFKCGALFAGAPRTGMSDLETVQITKSGRCIMALWHYYIDGLAVEVIYIEEGYEHPELKGVWHPRFGTGRFVIGAA
jgi:hypothetical protein